MDPFPTGKYRVVCYMRVDPPEGSPTMSLNEAKSEKENAEFMQPENIYRIEEVDEGGTWKAN